MLAEFNLVINYKCTFRSWANRCKGLKCFQESKCYCTWVNVLKQNKISPTLPLTLHWWCLSWLSDKRLDLKFPISNSLFHVHSILHDMALSVTSNLYNHQLERIELSSLCLLYKFIHIQDLFFSFELINKLDQMNIPIVLISNCKLQLLFILTLSWSGLNNKKCAL